MQNTSYSWGGTCDLISGYLEWPLAVKSSDNQQRGTEACNTINSLSLSHTHTQEAIIVSDCFIACG